MNTKPSITDNSSSPYDARIDAALHIYSRAVPAPDLETRILTQVSAAQHRTPDHGYGSISGWRIMLVQRLPRGVLGGALATAAGWAIVVGTLHHSSLHANLPQSARTTTTGGVSTGGGIHIPTQVTPERQGIDPAAPRTSGAWSRYRVAQPRAPLGWRCHSALALLTRPAAESALRQSTTVGAKADICLRTRLFRFTD